MTQVTSQRLTRALDSVRLPIEHFLETGFYDEGVLGERDWSTDITQQQVSRVCRKVAAELKRPFIQMGEVIERTAWVPDPSRPDGNGNYYTKSVRLPEPRWSRAYVSIPKRKGLTVLATPLILAASKEYAAPVQDRISATLWNFTIFDYQFWKEYYAFALNDPACRKARKLTS